MVRISLLFSLLLTACGGAPPDPTDMIWDPPLDDDTSATIDLGVVQQGEMVTATINGSNPTEADITLRLSCNFENGGFLVPGCPEEITVGPGEEMMPIRANLSSNLSGQYSGNFQFIYNDKIATFVVQGVIQ